MILETSFESNDAVLDTTFASNDAQMTADFGEVHQIPSEGLDQYLEQAVASYLKNSLPTASNEVKGVIRVGESLVIDEDGILNVNSATVVEEDNTLPVTSGAVYTEVGNINALLATI